MAEKILEVKNLTINFKTDNGLVQAVRGVSFDLERGETLCIVGESGSGKSVTSKAIMGILSSNAVVSDGTIMYGGENLLEISEEEFHRIRGHKIGMIFQDPLSSLNPIVRIGKQITEAMLINSDKLAIKYNELISKELVAYKNVIAKRRIGIAKAKDKCNLETEKILAEIKPKDKIIKLKEDNHFKIREESIKAKMEIKKLKASCRNEALSLKEKEQAKKENKAYLAELKAKLNEALKENKDNLELVNKIKADYQVKLQENVLNYQKKIESLTKSEEEQEKINKGYAEKINVIKEELAKFVALQNEKLQKDLDALKRTPEEIASLKAEMKRLVVVKNEEIAKVKAIAKEQLPPLKAALNSRKADAKQEIKDYKARLKATCQTKEEYINSIKITKEAAKAKALEIMGEVGIPLPEKRFRQYPFEFSGGMRQRIVIAIALTATPEILICDEPTTALDVTIQAQILELIKKIQKERNIACIFITHDLGVVANMADRVAVMYAGKIVEYGTSEEIFFEPKHPYTWALLSSIPDVDSKERLEAIPGTPPNMIYPPKGDAFALRSKYAMNIDFEEEPPYFKVSDTHYAKTWLLHPNAPKVEMPRIVSERIKNALNGRKEKEVASHE